MQDVSFYKVPMVCNSATSIGCGSRSKPILLALEKHSEIEEAWLKRDGTVIGIVWKPAVSKNQQQQIAKKIFDENKVDVIKLNDDEFLTVTADFKIPNAWYKGEEVNKLSKEEASIIAEQLITVFESKTQLNTQQKEQLTKDIITVFYDFFLNFNCIDELSDTKIYRQKMGEINSSAIILASSLLNLLTSSPLYQAFGISKSAVTLKDSSSFNFITSTLFSSNIFFAICCC